MNRTIYLPALIALLVLQIVAPILTGGGGAENLLANPGFEGDYVPYGAFETTNPTLINGALAAPGQEVAIAAQGDMLALGGLIVSIFGN